MFDGALSNDIAKREAYDSTKEQTEPVISTKSCIHAMGL